MKIISERELSRRECGLYGEIRKPVTDGEYINQLIYDRLTEKPILNLLIIGKHIERYAILNETEAAAWMLRYALEKGE